LRIFHEDRAQTGDYNFLAHLNECASKDDACVLLANEPLVHSLPESPINAEDVAWFELRTERADSGESQFLRFIVDQFALDAFDLELRAADGITVIDQDLNAGLDPDNPGGRRLIIEGNRFGSGPSKFYLLVKRSDLAATAYRIRWETDLTVLHGQGAGVPGAASENIYCVTETDTFGLDEIYLTVRVDGRTRVNDVYIGDYDGGSYRTLEDLLGTIRYLNGVEVILRDEDGGANGDDDIMSATIDSLAPDEVRSLNTTSSLACCGGSYLIRYNRSRSLLR
jgi:hypothetical protein